MGRELSNLRQRNGVPDRSDRMTGAAAVQSVTTLHLSPEAVGGQELPAPTGICTRAVPRRVLGTWPRGITACMLGG